MLKGANTANNGATLYYIHDPMCSWCWAFRPVWSELKATLPDNVSVMNRLGGLAPDTNEPMPEKLQHFLQNTWQKIEMTVPNTKFNFDFWTKCQPRRSTYPACRAVIAARQQGLQFEEPMILAIQQAYYQQAQNPSDDETLVTLAKEIGLESSQFRQQLHAAETQQQLEQEMDFNRHINAKSFPSLVLQFNGAFQPIKIDYLNAQTMLTQIQSILSHG